MHRSAHIAGRSLPESRISNNTSGCIRMSDHLSVHIAARSSNNRTVWMTIYGLIQERGLLNATFAPRHLRWNTICWCTDAFILAKSRMFVVFVGSSTAVKVDSTPTSKNTINRLMHRVAPMAIRDIIIDAITRRRRLSMHTTWSRKWNEWRSNYRECHHRKWCKSPISWNEENHEIIGNLNWTKMSLSDLSLISPMFFPQKRMDW